MVHACHEPHKETPVGTHRPKGLCLQTQSLLPPSAGRTVGNTCMCVKWFVVVYIIVCVFSISPDIVFYCLHQNHLLHHVLT